MFVMGEPALLRMICIDQQDETHVQYAEKKRKNQNIVCTVSL
jgi:hypothetical protein